MSLKKRDALKRSIYIVPNIFTTLSLCFGFYSILSSIEGRFSHAAWYIIIATLCDGLDGTVARATHTASRFGGAYDSLCDLAAFGAAPAVLVYLWALTPESLAGLGAQGQRLGAPAAFIFLACGALRLARFNVFSGTRDPGFFQGLPITGGALMVSAAALWSYRRRPPLAPDGPLILFMVLSLALLMVSSFDYVSHKNKALFRNKRPFETLAVSVIALVLLIANSQIALWPVGFLYLLSGPAVTAWRAGRRIRIRNNKTIL